MRSARSGLWSSQAGRAGGLLAAFMLVSAGAGAAGHLPLTGKWAGDRVAISFDPDGATIKSDCAQGRLVGLVRPDRRGNFTARALFDVIKPGPQLADQPGPTQSASISGRLRGDAIAIEIDRGNGRPAQHATLHRGGLVKFVRCL